MDKFRVIVITPPEILSDEASVINSLLESGAAERVHLRHPEADEKAIRSLISDIRPNLRSRLSLHSHFCLTEEYGVGGIHLNRREPICTHRPEHLSISCHSFEEAEAAIRSGRFSYLTLSPVYDSISKEGYSSRFSPSDPKLRTFLERNQTPTGVIALGGVTPEKFPELAAAGFAGGAMLGYVWNNLETARRPASKI